MTDSQPALSKRFPALRRLAAPGARKVPYVAQHSNVECGVACLAMVLEYHGKHVAREALRQALGPTRDGVRAGHLLRGARHFGLRARGVKAELDALAQVPRGSVLHWQFNHYVVLQGVGKGYADIVDPARGARRVSWEELDKSFTGVVLLFEPGSDFVTGDGVPKRRGIYADLLRSGDWPRIFGVSFASQLVTLALPMLVALVVDRVLPRSDRQLLYVVTFGLGLAVLFYALSQIVRGHLLLHLRTLLDAKLTMELVDRMLALPIAFFQQRSVGDLILRLESSKMVREVLTSGALSAVLDGSMMLLYLALLFALSSLLGGVVVALGAINVLVLVGMRGRRRAFQAQLIERQAASESYQHEMLNAIETIKGMGCEHRAVDRFSNLFVDLLNNQLAYGRLEIVFQSLTSVLRLGAPLVIFTLGAIEVLDGRMSIGTMLAVNTFAVGIFDPLSRLVEKLEQLERLGLYVDRMMDVYDSPREQPLGKPPVHEKLRGEIVLDGVSFRHGPMEPAVLQDVSVAIQPGEFVAIVGPSGAGKSTLANLMLGLYPPTSGCVAFDGRPIQELELASLRAQIGVVTQSTQLFAGTIRSNIALADPDVAQAQVEHAAKLANIHDDIMRMPAGYNSVLSTGGGAISGGQRQRIALARALVQSPAILVLDEATSALDTASEAAIQHALEQLRCTRVVIAHRLSTVARADRILVMEGGRLVEQGTPRELLLRGGAYARLVHQQVGGGAPQLLAAAAVRAPKAAKLTLPGSHSESVAASSQRSPRVNAQVAAAEVTALKQASPAAAASDGVAPDLVITQRSEHSPQRAVQIRASGPQERSRAVARAPESSVNVVVGACQVVGRAEPTQRSRSTSRAQQG